MLLNLTLRGKELIKTSAGREQKWKIWGNTHYA